jgi:hypothetical protein
MPTHDDGTRTARGDGAGGEGSPQGLPDTVQQAEGQVKEKAREVTDRVKEKSEELRDDAERRADRWTSEMGDRIEGVARALRSAGEALEDQGEGRMSAMASSVAEQVERMGGYLHDENPRAMLRDLEDTARRNPGVFVGSTFVAGLLLGRFLRASEGGGGATPGREDETSRAREIPALDPAASLAGSPTPTPAGRFGHTQQGHVGPRGGPAAEEE